jgi:hypothetical protein
MLMILYQKCILFIAESQPKQRKIAPYIQLKYTFAAYPKIVYRFYTQAGDDVPKFEPKGVNSKI